MKFTAKHTDFLLSLFYNIFFVSLIFSFRAVSTISMGFIFLISIIKNKIETGNFFNSRLLNAFIICCCIFYLQHLFSLFYTNNIPETIKDLLLKSAIILVPLALCCSNYISPVSVDRLMKDYVLIITAGMMFYIGFALYTYIFSEAVPEVFFYHALVSPFAQNAVEVSALLFFGLIYLVHTYRSAQLKGKAIKHLVLIIFFICCIILLSSKLVIIFSVAFILYSLIVSLKNNTRVLAFTCMFIFLVITLVAVTRNPVSSRFNEIVSSNISLAAQEKFTPAIYFNGLQFRLLQWRFVAQILSDNNAWLAGVSPGDAQALLDQKYIATNMYIGETGHDGFLGYNTHNQYLQSLLENGIIGLLFYMAVCLCLVVWAFLRKNIVLSFTVLFLVVYGLIDSTLESQYGLLLFTFWPVVFYFGFARPRPLPEIIGMYQKGGNPGK